MSYTETILNEMARIRIYKRPDCEWGWMVTLFERTIVVYEVGIYPQPKEFASWKFKNAKECLLSFDENKMREKGTGNASFLTLLNIHINNFKNNG